MAPTGAGSAPRESEEFLMAHIVLASASPRRQELLQRMGITEFDIRVPEAEETYPEGLSPLCAC